MEGRKDRGLERRKYAVGGGACLMVALFLARLFALQLMSGQYAEQAQGNAVLRQTLYPARGAIRDRNGALLVYDQPAYDIMVVMSEQEGVDTLALCEALGIDRREYERRMDAIRDRARNPGYSPLTRQLFMAQLGAGEFARFRERMFLFPGFYARRGTARRYDCHGLGHVLGDVAEVSRAEVDADPYYSPGDRIGKQGVERSYERWLRGEKGAELLLRDARGRVKGRYEDGALDTRPRPGSNITLSIDTALQALGERLMRGKLGAIVALEPATGEVLCMVSSPGYDPALMSGPGRGQALAELSADPLRPLLNRAVGGVYPPGSTFKPSQALAFLQEGVITPQTSFPCQRGFRHGRLRVGCHGHPSPLPLVPALATSCNGYFCWGLARMMADRRRWPTVQAAMDRWRDHMVAMGFGYRLGVDLPGEARGMIPNSGFYDRAYGASWTGLTVISISIGQGEVSLTPLQIANLGATIANRGWYITPHVVREVEGAPPDTALLRRRRTLVDPRHYETVARGMRQAVLGGTCRAAETPLYEVCGKTGTAQNRGHDHSAFMGFAPKDEPRIAVCVYVENGGWGATYGVPIGALIMERWLTGGLCQASQARARAIEEREISYGGGWR